MTGLAVALGLGGATVAGQAEAVGPNCKVGVTTDRYVEVETHPEVIVSLTECGSGKLVVDVQSSTSTTSITVGTVQDGEKNVWAGVTEPGSYNVRARVDSLTTAWKPFTIINWPTAYSAGTKLVGEVTNAWGRFDVNQSITAWTEVWLGDRWSKSQQRTTTSSGSYVIPLTYGTYSPGVHQFRVAGQYPGGAVFYSDEFVLERVSRPTAYSAGVKVVGEATNAWGRFDTVLPTSVWTEVWLGNKWSRSQTTTTRSDGSYVLPLTYGASASGTTRWRVVGNPDSTGRAISNEFNLRRVQAPSAASAGSTRVGATSNVWGTFHTSGERLPVWTEVWTGSGWSKSQERTTTESGWFVIPLTYGADDAGTTRWRVAAQYPEGVLRSGEVSLRRY